MLLLFAALAAGVVAAQSPFPQACNESAPFEVITAETGSLLLGGTFPDVASLPVMQCIWILQGAAESSVVTLEWLWIDFGDPVSGCTLAEASVGAFDENRETLSQECTLPELRRQRRRAVSVTTRRGTDLRRILRASPLPPPEFETASATATEVLASASAEPSLELYGPFSTQGSMYVVATIDAAHRAYGFEAVFAIDNEPGTSPSPALPSAPLPSPPSRFPSANATVSASASPAFGNSSNVTASATPSPSSPCVPKRFGPDCPTPAATPSGTANATTMASPNVTTAASATGTPNATTSRTAPVLASRSATPLPPNVSPSRTPPPSVTSTSTRTRVPASASSVPASALPVPSPASAGATTAQVALQGTRAWASLDPAVLAAGLVSDVASVLALQPYVYRLSATVRGGGALPVTAVLQVQPPLSGPPAPGASSAEPSTAAVLGALFAALQDPSSPLWSSPVAKSISPVAGAWQAVWATPPALQLSSAALKWALPYVPPPAGPSGARRDVPQLLTVSNAGGSDLVLASAAVTLIDGGGSRQQLAAGPGGAASPPCVYGPTLFQLQSPPAASFPITLAPGARVEFTLIVSGAALPTVAGQSACALSASAFGLLELQHNVPSAPHSVGLAMDVTGAPGGGGGGGGGDDGSAAGVLGSAGFKVGLSTGAGTVLLLGIAVAVAVCQCRRHCGRKSGFTASAAGGASSASQGTSRPPGPIPSQGSSDSSDDDGKGGKKKVRDKQGSGGSKEKEKDRDGKKRDVSYSLSSDEGDGGNSRRGRGRKRGGSKKGSGRRGSRSGSRGSGSSSSSSGSGSGGEGDRVVLNLGADGKSSSRRHRHHHKSSSSSSAVPAPPAGSSWWPSTAGAAASSGPAANGGLELAALPSSSSSTSTTVLSSGGSGLSFAGLAVKGAPSSAPAPESTALAGGSSAFPGSSGSGAKPAASAGSSLSSVGGGGIRLRAKPVLRAADFERQWSTLLLAELWGGTLAQVPLDGELERTLAPHGVACMASGSVGGVSKLYFYAQEESSGAMCMAEVSVTHASRRLSAVVKAADAATGAAFVAHFTRLLAPLLQTPQQQQQADLAAAAAAVPASGAAGAASGNSV